MRGILDLVESGLATWRLSYLLVHEEGPWGLAKKLRSATGIQEINGKAFSWPDWTPLACIYCTSVWVGFAMLVVPSPIRRALVSSALAIIVQELYEGCEDGSS